MFITNVKDHAQRDASIMGQAMFNNPLVNSFSSSGLGLGVCSYLTLARKLNVNVAIIN